MACIKYNMFVHESGSVPEDLNCNFKSTSYETEGLLKVTMSRVQYIVKVISETVLTHYHCRLLLGGLK